MEFLVLFMCVIPSIVTPITVSSNGNSPEIKMSGGMMVDIQKGFVPMTDKPDEPMLKSNNETTQVKPKAKLSINERYRRLIPYMTFYYANDLATPTTEAYDNKNVEVEKAEIVEAGTIEPPHQRQPKKIVYSSHRNIPRYQGNRLTQHNIASANPIKHYVPLFHNTPKISTNYNPLLLDHSILSNNDYEHGRFTQKQIIKSPSFSFAAPTRKPYLNLYHGEDAGGVQYYLPEKDHAPKYKLVPYEQTPPVKVIPQNENTHETKKFSPVSVLVPKEHIFIKPRPVRPQYYYDNSNIPQTPVRKPVTVVSESYYEKRPNPSLIQPYVESGFKPILTPAEYTTEAPEAEAPQYENEKHHSVQVLANDHERPEINDQNYYQYVVEQPAYKPPIKYVPSNTVSLSDLINSLQLSKSLPKPITRENVGASIRTLLQVLNALKAAPQQNDVEPPVLSTPKPFVAPKVVAEVTPKPVVTSTPVAIVDDPDFHEEPYLAPVNTPSQHLDDFPTGGGTSQQFPLPVTSDDEGGTPGRPGIDYPILTTIPHTAFDCKTQRYKGFFADPETRCQVWHYCDLNGGQASFLCPNGTIFSQAGLTCDWWFNVRCASTAQLYVLNESLYKYILPHSPKFPEDYSGPLVDKYLTLKFKEMEEQFRKNKNKQTAKEKMDSDEKEDSSEESSEETSEENNKSSDANEKTEVSSVSEASVIVQSPGASGQVERLQV